MWKWHIHLSDSPDLRCAQNNRVEGYQSKNRVQNKTRWTQTENFKAVRWFDNYYYQQNYNRPIMTIKKDHFPQHDRWWIRNRMPGSGLKLHSLTLTPTVVAKQRRKRYTFALDMRERPVCYWRRVYFPEGTMITDNFYDTNQNFICGSTVPKISLHHRWEEVSCPSKKLCWFALWYGTIYAMESYRRYSEQQYLGQNNSWIFHKRTDEEFIPGKSSS